MSHGIVRAMANGLTLAAGRDCGDCTLCCSVFTIDKSDIQKAAGVTCRNCVTAGCAIYATRPQVCRDYQCGWRQLAMLDESWRPDRSGVLVELEAAEGRTGLSLMLVGDALAIVQAAWFVDFVAVGLRNAVPLSLALPGPRGHQGVKRALNNDAMRQAAQQSRAAVSALLEQLLVRLSAHAFQPHDMIHNGHDMGG